MTSSSRTSNTIKNIFVGSVAQILTLVLSFLLRTVFVHSLGNEYLSVNGLFTNVLTILTFTDLGIGSAVIYSLYKPLSINDQAQIGRIINLISVAYRYIACVIALLGLILVPFLGYIVNSVPNVKEDITFLYLLFLANTVFSYIYGYKKSLLIADQKNYIVVLIYTIVHLLQIIVQTVVLLYLSNFILFLLVMLVCTLLNNILSTIYVNKKYVWLHQVENLKLNENDRKSIFCNIKNIVIYKIGTILLNSSSSIVISVMLRTTLVGITSNYLLIINAIQAIITQGFAGVSASIGNYNVSSTPKQNEEIFNQLNIISFWIFGSLTVVLSLVINPFVDLWLGHEYVLSGWESVIMVLGFYSLVINIIPSSYRTAMGLFKEARYAPVLAAIINLLLSILGAYFIGIIGVFLALFLARLFSFCLIDPYYVYKKGFHTSSENYIMSIFYKLIIILSTVFIVEKIIIYLSVGEILSLLLKGGLGLILFQIAFFLYYYKNPNMVKVFSKIFKQIR